MVLVTIIKSRIYKTAKYYKPPCFTIYLLSIDSEDVGIQKEDELRCDEIKFQGDNMKIL